jgi:hypothetical protein
MTWEHKTNTTCIVYYVKKNTTQILSEFQNNNLNLNLLE